MGESDKYKGMSAYCELISSGWLCRQQDSGYVDDCVMVKPLNVHVNTAVFVAPSGDQVCITFGM